MGRVFSSSSVLVLASVSLCLLHLSIGLWLNTEEPVGEITDTPALLHYPRSAARVSVRLSSRCRIPKKDWTEKRKRAKKKMRASWRNESRQKKRGLVAIDSRRISINTRRVEYPFFCLTPSRPLFSCRWSLSWNPSCVCLRVTQRADGRPVLVAPQSI